ncbi:hypothetical protein L596_001005 [Steinernema carpocapsae]|uniref:Uncharacterized protein n=1 Tax=Steinernema carpocapsae TaxID=34508 RepID=A0A4U8UM46_STECR|nr:hypothetical protein L596_001005 [Steinernema carpocapsae]
MSTGRVLWMSIHLRRVTSARQDMRQMVNWLGRALGLFKSFPLDGDKNEGEEGLSQDFAAPGCRFSVFCGLILCIFKIADKRNRIQPKPARRPQGYSAPRVGLFLEILQSCACPAVLFVTHFDCGGRSHRVLNLEASASERLMGAWKQISSSESSSTDDCLNVLCSSWRSVNRM